MPKYGKGGERTETQVDNCALRSRSIIQEKGNPWSFILETVRTWKIVPITARIDDLAGGRRRPRHVQEKILMGSKHVIAQNCYFSANQKAERLHGASARLCLDVQSPLHRVSHTMKNKKNNKKVAAKPRKQNKKPTPFGDVGAMLGQGIGSMFGVSPIAKNIGRWLGTGIGSIFGSGDYSISGNRPDYNVLMNSAQIPQFVSGKVANYVSHREYLGEISGAAAFTNRKYPLNPGMVETFPWLSTVAQNYQQYKFHGLMFEFRSLITDFVTSGQPGTVCMATNYDADQPLFTNKIEMNNSEYAVSTKPTINLIHGIECAPSQTSTPIMYVRTGALADTQDLNANDLGNFQLASQGNPASSVLGELWVTYVVEFLKPKVPDDVGGDIKSGYAYRATVAPAAPWGTTTTRLTGDNGLNFSGTVLGFNGVMGNYYLVSVNWTGSAAAAITFPTVTVTNGTQVSIFGNGTVLLEIAPTAGSPVLSALLQVVVQPTITGQVFVTLGTGGAYPTGTTNAEIFVTPFSTTI